MENSSTSTVMVVSDVATGGAAGSTQRMLRQIARTIPSLSYVHFSSDCRYALPFAVSLDPGKKRPTPERLVKIFSRNMANSMMAVRHRKAFLDTVQCSSPRLINLRNIHSCGLSHDSVLDIPPSVSLVWTLHDCWAVAPYAFKFLDQNGRMDYTLGSQNRNLSIRKRKMFFSKRPDCVIVAPSKWIAAEADRWLPSNVSVVHIPNGVDTDVFKPMDKILAKSILGLDQNKIWFGFASTWANFRKGSDILVDGLADFAKLQKGAEVGLFSWGGIIPDSKIGNIEVHQFGTIKSDYISALLYAAADIFVCPSRADNLPNTCLEAIACGTPVVASNAGGIPEIVINEQTGWLFENGSKEDFVNSLRDCVAERSNWNAFGEAAREHAENTFSVDLAAERYVDLYSQILSK